MSTPTNHTSSEFARLQEEIKQLNGIVQQQQSDLETSQFTHTELINLREKALTDLKVSNFHSVLLSSIAIYVLVISFVRIVTKRENCGG